MTSCFSRFVTITTSTEGFVARFIAMTIVWCAESKPESEPRCALRHRLILEAVVAQVTIIVPILSSEMRRRYSDCTGRSPPRLHRSARWRTSTSAGRVTEV